MKRGAVITKSLSSDNHTDPQIRDVLKSMEDLQEAAMDLYIKAQED